MNIDKEKLKTLAEDAQNDSGDYAALNDYGMAVPPAVTLALLAEIEALHLRCDRLDADKEAMAKTHVLYTWLRKKVDQPSNDAVAVYMNIGHDWVPVRDLDQDLQAMIDQEEP